MAMLPRRRNRRGLKSPGLLIASLLLSAWGCHGGDPTPVSPASPPPTAETLTITIGPDALRTGFFADFTVMASMSDRTSQNVTRLAAWTTSDASVATVDSNGRVSAVRNGSITLTAAYQGRVASRTIRIVHNYSGQWNGTYVVRSCNQTGVFASSGYCQNLGTTPLPFGLQIAQSGPNLDMVTGLISLRGLVGSVSGSIGTDGTLVLTGSYTAADSGGVDMRVGIPSWSTTPAGDSSMTGSFVETLAVVGSDGSANEMSEIVTATQKLDGSSFQPKP